MGYKGIEKRMIRLHEARDEFLQRLVDEVRSKNMSSLKKAGEGKRSVAEVLLSLQESEPEFFSDNIVKAMINGKLQAEIEDQVGNDRIINETDLLKLPYLRCIVDETPRVHPSTPMLLPNFSSKECNVGGYKVPRGTTLMTNAWAVHRDPRLWEMPDEFRPERFQERVHREKEFNSKYLPFGMGRRSCPGANLGLHIVSLRLGVLVQCFEWENVSGIKADTVIQGVGPQSKAKPLEVFCSPRENMVQVLSHLVLVSASDMAIRSGKRIIYPLPNNDFTTFFKHKL